MEWRTINELAHFDFLHEGMRRGIIEQSGMQYAFHFEHRPGATVLIVSLANLVARQFGKPPSLDPLSWAERRDFHLLSIFDPTLFMNDEVEVGMFQGQVDRDPIPGICRIADHVASQLSIADVVFWGSSGGGFAAVKAASRSGHSATAINAQVGAYPSRHWQVMKDHARVFGNMNVSDFCVLHPERSSIVGDLRRRTARHILWVQNIDDVHHYKRHYPAVCNIFGLPLSGGTSNDGRLTAHLYRSAEGHAPPSADMHRRILEVAFSVMVSRPD